MTSLEKNHVTGTVAGVGDTALLLRSFPSGFYIHFPAFWKGAWGPSWQPVPRQSWILWLPSIASAASPPAPQMLQHQHAEWEVIWWSSYILTVATPTYTSACKPPTGRAFKVTFGHFFSHWWMMSSMLLSPSVYLLLYSVHLESCQCGRQYYKK